MQYRLKKDLPWASRSDVVWVEDVTKGIDGFITWKVGNNVGTLGFITMSTVEFYNWFEKVDERWKPELNEKFFLVEDDGSIDFCNWHLSWRICNMVHTP